MRLFLLMSATAFALVLRQESFANAEGIHPCRIVSPAQLQALLGFPFDEGEFDDAAVDSTKCKFKVVEQAATSLSPKPTSVMIRVFAPKFSSVSGFKALKQHFSTFSDGPLREVKGIGDEAFIEPFEEKTIIFRTGDKSIGVTVQVPVLAAGPSLKYGEKLARGIVKIFKKN